MTQRNELKAKLAGGGTVFGTWSMLASPAVMSVIASSGVDFGIIDMEHGPMGLETAEAQLHATETGGATPIVRLGEASDAQILRVLDIGTQALMVSHVSSAADAKRIVDAVRYPPEGTRGLSPFTRRHDFSDHDLPAKLQRANDEMFVGVLVEGDEGLANLDEIAATPGLDMVYLGIYDMSSAAGMPGQLDHPKVVDAIRDAAKRIDAHGVVAGSVARDRDYLHLLHDAGYRFLSYRADSPILRDGIVTARGWYDELTG
jgi:4-hydroxy-2-oxoheptanedioate aldolase